MFLYKRLNLCEIVPPPPFLYIIRTAKWRYGVREKSNPLVCSDFPSTKIHRKILGDNKSHKKQSILFISRAQSQKDNTVWSISFCCVPGLVVSITVRLTRMHVADITEYSLEKRENIKYCLQFFSCCDPISLQDSQSRIPDTRSKIKNCHLFVPRPLWRTPKLQEKSLALNREHPALQTKKFLHLFSFIVGIFFIVDQDIVFPMRSTSNWPNPTRIYADPDPDHYKKQAQKPVLRIRIRIHRIHMFLGLLDPDPDPLVRCMDPDQDPALDPDPDPSIIMQK